jgi:hypothetical protein
VHRKQHECDARNTERNPWKQYAHLTFTFIIYIYRLDDFRLRLYAHVDSYYHQKQPEKTNSGR